MAPPDHGPVPRQGPGGWKAQTMKHSGGEGGSLEDQIAGFAQTTNTLSPSTAEVRDAGSLGCESEVFTAVQL